jgi:hypothetical protein
MVLLPLCSSRAAWPASVSHDQARDQARSAGHHRANRHSLLVAAALSCLLLLCSALLLLLLCCCQLLCRG